MGSYSTMEIADSDVEYYAEQQGYELSEEIADTIAQVLADTWEIDYDYETFMEEGVFMEIDRMLQENPDLRDKGIHKLTEDEIKKREKLDEMLRKAEDEQ